MDWRRVRGRTSAVEQWIRRLPRTWQRYRWWSLGYGEVARAERHGGAGVPGAEQEEQAVAVLAEAAQECAERRAVVPRACASGLLQE